MSPINDRAIVIRLTEFAETSQVATFFSARTGQIRLIAKGIKRGTKARFAAGLDLLELGDLAYLPAKGDAGLGILTGWVQRGSFNGLRRDLPRLYGGMYMAELVTSLTQENDPHEELFEGFCEGLQDLCGDGSPADCVVRFQLLLLRSIGYLPDLSRCMDCGRAPPAGADAYFSSSAGGLICRDCELHHFEKRHAPESIVGVEAGSGTAKAWFSVLDYHLTQISGSPFRTSHKTQSALAEN